MAIQPAVPLEVKMFCPHDQPETDSQESPSQDELSTSSNTVGGRVNFNLWEEVHVVPSAKNLSEAEFHKIWYDPKDYDKMMDHCEKTVDLMEEGKRFKEKKLTSLGLEHWTKSGYKKRQRNKYGGIDSVLNEQFAQWEEGVDDEESISELYIASTADSKMAAATNGLKLEREVQEYLAAGTIVESDDCVSVLTCSVRTERTEPSTVRWSVGSSHSAHSRSSNHSRCSMVSSIIGATMKSNSSTHSRDSTIISMKKNSSTHSKQSVGPILKSSSTHSRASTIVSMKKNASNHSRGSVASAGRSTKTGAGRKVGSTHSRGSVASVGSSKKTKVNKEKASTHSRGSVASVGSAAKKTKGIKKSSSTHSRGSVSNESSAKKKKTKASIMSGSTHSRSSAASVGSVQSKSSKVSVGSKSSKASKSPRKPKRVSTKIDSASNHSTASSIVSMAMGSSTHSRSSKVSVGSKSSKASKSSTASRKKIPKSKSTKEEKYNKCTAFLNKHLSSSDSKTTTVDTNNKIGTKSRPTKDEKMKKTSSNSRKIKFSPKKKQNT